MPSDHISAKEIVGNGSCSDEQLHFDMLCSHRSSSSSPSTTITRPLSIQGATSVSSEGRHRRTSSPSPLLWLGTNSPSSITTMQRVHRPGAQEAIYGISNNSCTSSSLFPTPVVVATPNSSPARTTEHNFPQPERRPIREPESQGSGDNRTIPVIPAISSTVARTGVMPSLSLSARTSFQPLQDPRGTSRTYAMGYRQNHNSTVSSQRKPSHHRSASWTGGEEEDSFVLFPIRTTPTRDMSASPRSTPSPNTSDSYTAGIGSGLNHRSTTTPTNVSCPIQHQIIRPIDGCERLRSEVREMLVQNELDNIAAQHILNKVADGVFTSNVNFERGDEEKVWETGRCPGDAKVLAKRQALRTPAVFLPVSTTEISTS